MATDTEFQYALQLSDNRTAVWVHSTDGSTVGRFGRMGVDLHNTATAMSEGAAECRLCTHGPVAKADWDLFREKVHEWWGVEVPEDAFDSRLFKAS